VYMPDRVFNPAIILISMRVLQYFFIPTDFFTGSYSYGGNVPIQHFF
jgi:hypothetical protein